VLGSEFGGNDSAFDTYYIFSDTNKSDTIQSLIYSFMLVKFGSDSLNRSLAVISYSWFIQYYAPIIEYDYLSAVGTLQNLINDKNNFEMLYNEKLNQRNIAEYIISTSEANLITVNEKIAAIQEQIIEAALTLEAV
jgi:hypothetical protein